MTQLGFAEERFVQNGQLRLWSESFGKKSDPPILLIMGGGCQGILWPDDFCQRLVEEGYFVIRYDHRDTGQSSASEERYTLHDMAGDAVMVLETWGIEEAHVLGESMGGVVAQILAHDFPERVKTLGLLVTTPDISIMARCLEGRSLENEPLPKPWDSYLAWGESLLSRKIETEEAALALKLEGWEIVNGPKAPFDREYFYKVLLKAEKRDNNPSGVNKHLEAIIRTPFSAEALKGSSIPIYVISGDQDPIFPKGHGEALAEILEAPLTAIPEMGHCFNPAFYDDIVLVIKRESRI